MIDIWWVGVRFWWVEGAASHSSVIPASSRDPAAVRLHGEREPFVGSGMSKESCAADAALLDSCDKHRNDGRRRRRRETIFRGPR